MKKIIKTIWEDFKKHAPIISLVVVLLLVLAILNWLSGGIKNEPSEQASIDDAANIEESVVDIDELINTFPLLKGSYWTYQASVKWTKVGGEIVEKDLTWKMEVIDTAVYKNIIAVHLKGFPWELDWHYEDYPKRGDYTMLIVDAKKFYLLEGTEAFEQIKNKEDLTYDSSEDNLWFDFPLILGKSYSHMNEFAKQRDDHYYQWYVKSESPADLESIKGILPTTAAETEYEIEFYTLPAHRIINFVPGIGITGYTYVHHGTISEAYLKLVEFYLSEMD